MPALNPGSMVPPVGGFMKVVEVIGEISKGLSSLAHKVVSFADKMTHSWRDIQDEAFKAGRAIGMSRDQAMAYNRVLQQQTKELGRQYGITFKDIAKFQTEYVKNTNRAIVLNRQAVESMAQLNRLAGESTASQLVDDMDRFGVSISEATVKVATIHERARQMGLSTQAASDILAKNIRLASTYQFKNGIDSLQKMVLKSQALRVNMESVVAASDRFQNIESAITSSAQLQMLGGSFAAQFSNPMAVMNEALNDQNAFFDRITKAVEGRAVFDRKTGEARISGLDQQFIKAAADALGMSREELSQMALRKAQGGAVEKEISGAQNFSEIQREFIKTQARWDAQLQQFVVDQKNANGEAIGTAKVSDLTPEMVKSMQASEFTEKNLWGDVRAIRDMLSQRFGERAAGTTSFNENITGLQSEWEAFKAQFQNLWSVPGSNWFNGGSFQPWDLFKKVSGLFAEGGIVDSSAKPNIQAPIKAQLGTIVPGQSYTGDKVPVLANSGEMILNKQEQGGLFDLIKKAGATLITAYAGNKLGNKFGLGNIGTMAAFGNLMSGGNMGVGGMMGTMASIGMASKVLPKLYGKMPMMTSPMLRSPMLGGMGATLTLMNPTVYMNGAVNMNSNGIVDAISDLGVDGVGKKGMGRGLKPKSVLGRWLRMKYNSDGGIKGRYDKLLGNIKSSTNAIGKGVGSFGVKSISKLGSIGKLAGIGGRLPVVGAGLTTLGSGIAIASEVSNYNDKLREIEASSASRMEKARAKDKAEKDRNKGIGGAIGTGGGALGGAAAGAAIGSVLLPGIGTLIGGAIGGFAGSGLGKAIGSGIGGLFGGGNEKKELEEEKERNAYINGSKELAEPMKQLPKLLKDIVTELSYMNGSRARMRSDKDASLREQYARSSDNNPIKSVDKFMFTPVLPHLGGLMAALDHIKQAPIPTAKVVQNVQAKEVIGTKTPITPVTAPTAAVKSVAPVGPQKIDLNVSGTIKLDAGGQTTNIDLEKLMKDPQFVNSITEMVKKRMSELNYNGKQYKTMN